MSEPKKILCVEDDPDSCELLELLLGNEGFEVVACSDSQKALKLAKQKHFSAIILDHRLADISGVEICCQIRTYDQQTPIIFYSCAAFPQEIEAGLAAGANAYLIKPSDLVKIADTVNGLIS